MRVLFFTDGPTSPGSRFRCLQLFPALEQRGIHCDVRFAYDRHYNEFHEKPWAPLYKAHGRLKRAARLVLAHGYDLLFLHKTSLAVAGLPEVLRRYRATPSVFDFDDAIYLGAHGHPSTLRDRAFHQAVDSATAVIAGNRHLAAQTKAPSKTITIPSVVDTDRYTPGQAKPAEELVVGWMGTASNFPYLRAAIPMVLAALEQLPRARLRIVSNGTLPEYLSHPLVEQWRWTEGGEVKALQSFHLGLMPVPDTEQTRGKCGFKMLQYMACGVPVLASAIGANVDIFDDSHAGRLVNGSGWKAPLLELASDPALRASMGRSGREHAIAHYSVTSVIERYVALFNRLTGSTATAA
jgi:glycosyltransferase involved in cell wall biosynthesis